MTNSFLFSEERYDTTNLKKLSDEKLHKLDVELAIAWNVYWTVYAKKSEKIGHLDYAVGNEHHSRHYSDYKHPVTGKAHNCHIGKAYFIKPFGEDANL